LMIRRAFCTKIEDKFSTLLWKLNSLERKIETLQNSVDQLNTK